MTPNTTNDEQASYACQIAATKCPTDCGNPQCAPAADAPAPRIAAHRLAEMRAGLPGVNAPIWFKMQVIDLIIALNAAEAELQQARQELAEAEVDKLVLIRELAAACGYRRGS